MDEEEYFDIYGTPPMRAALGLYAGHKAVAQAALLADEEDEEKYSAFRRLRERSEKTTPRGG